MFIFQITFCRSVSGTKILFELEKGCAGWDILVLSRPPAAAGATSLLPVARTGGLSPSCEWRQARLSLSDWLTSLSTAPSHRDAQQATELLKLMSPPLSDAYVCLSSC